MSTKTTNIVYTSLACVLILIIGIWFFGRDSKNVNPASSSADQSAILKEKADAFSVIIEAKLPKEKAILSKEGDQAKFIDADKNIINEFNSIFDETATTK